MSENLVKVVDQSAVGALQRYAEAQAFRGKAIIDTYRKIMRFWVHFAMRKIPAGSSSRIRANLTQVVTTYSNIAAASRGLRSNITTRRVIRNRTADKWRGTLADRIVRTLNAKNGTRLSPAKFTASKAWSANLHKAGLKPAISGAGVSYSGRLPKLKRPAGAYRETLGDQIVSILAENFASANGPRAAGIARLAPGAFELAQNEVETMVAKWLDKAVRDAAKAVGFYITPT